MVLFCKNAPPLMKVIMQSQPDSPQSASRKRPVPEPVAPRAPIKARKKMGFKKVQKERRTPSLDQEASNVYQIPSSPKFLSHANIFLLILAYHPLCRIPLMILLVKESRKYRCLKKTWTHPGEIITILAKSQEEPQETITSSSAVIPAPGKVYSFCFTCPSLLIHTDFCLLVRVLTSRDCYRLTLHPLVQPFP